MMTFALAVLGSVIFWIIAIPINLIIGIIVLKSTCPTTLNPFLNQKEILNEYKHAEYGSYFGSLIIILLVGGIWPFVITLFTLIHVAEYVEQYVMPIIGEFLSKYIGKFIKQLPTIKITKE